MSEASLSQIVALFAERGYTAEKAAVRRIQREPDPSRAVEHVLERAPDSAITITETTVEAALDSTNGAAVSSQHGPALEVTRDMTGASTGTGSYEDFVALFRDRYQRMRSLLEGRVHARSIAALSETTRAHGIGVIGMIRSIRSSKNGHWVLELEDRTGVCRCLINKDGEHFDLVDRLVHDEVIGVEGSLSDDGDMLFVDEVYLPEVPISNEASRADRHVEAALVSDLHVGSEDFAAEAWDNFAEWLHSEAAEPIEYLLIGGDMVEGVGVYPGQAEELSIVDIYAQYERFREVLKDVPGDLEIVMIPGNHDAVRLAEPQPGFDEELRGIMRAHDATIASNPAWVNLEGVSVLMYHGTSLDDVIAKLPGDLATYDAPDRAMRELLRKRHLAPTYGDRTRIAPEERDHLVIDEVPDVFHAGHTHTLGVDGYRDVRLVNSGCWQYQTPYQRQMNIEPDVGTVPIVDLSTLDVTVRTFA